MIDEENKKASLREARLQDQRKSARETLRKNNSSKKGNQTKQAIQDAKNIIKTVRSPRGVFSLLKYGNPITDWMYGLALFAAILKDILDFIESSGIGYILVIIATLLVSIFIAAMMLIGSASNGSRSRTQQKIIRSWLILLGGTTAEMLFGIDILPIETITVLIIYFLVLLERKTSREE